MYTIAQLSANPNQTQTVILPDGSGVALTFNYFVQQRGWFFSLTYGDDFALNNIRVFNTPNMLYQFQNNIPFGIACTTAGNREPTQLQDFASGAAVLYFLDAADCATVTGIINGELTV